MQGLKLNNDVSVNKQQVDRKRHIGNDVITIIFQEPGAAPFSPAESGVRSQFQHIFVIVRAHVSKSSEEGTSEILKLLHIFIYYVIPYYVITSGM